MAKSGPLGLYLPLGLHTDLSQLGLWPGVTPLRTAACAHTQQSVASATSRRRPPGGPYLPNLLRAGPGLQQVKEKRRQSLMEENVGQGGHQPTSSSPALSHENSLELPGLGRNRGPGAARAGVEAWQGSGGKVACVPRWANLENLSWSGASTVLPTLYTSAG